MVPNPKFLDFAAVCLLLHAPGAAFAQTRPPGRESVIVSPDAQAPKPAQPPTDRGRTFVPLHSTLVDQGGVRQLNFSGALSVHNASAQNALVVDRIDYRGGSGELIESYVTEPIVLRPYGSLQVNIAQNDVRGGTGASFTVDWSTAAGSDEPVIEAVMAAFAGTRSFSFLSPGRRVSRPQ